MSSRRWLSCAASTRRTPAACTASTCVRCCLGANSPAGCVLFFPSLTRHTHGTTASDALYLVTDFCAGGQLLHALLAKKGNTGYSERDCRTAFTALLRALCYLHARGVTHRDVKLDNVLLAAPGDLTTVRLVDFGLAASWLAIEPDAPEPAMTWMCGSAPYMAPEVALRRIPYTDACDMWSAGVVLHLLLTGHMPFAAPAGTAPQEEDEAVLGAAKAVHWAVTCDAPEWAGVSHEAKDLTRALLQPEPGLRLSAAQALLHPWVGGDVAGGGADLSGALSRLTRFVAIADLPSVKLPPGTLLTADGSVGGSLFKIDGGVFLIKTGTVDVLVPDESSPHWPPSSASSADDGMRPMRRVGSRGAGELVGELSMMHVDGAGKVTWGAHAHAAGEGSGRHALTPSLSRKSSGGVGLSAAAGEAGSEHGSDGGSRHAAGGDGSCGDAPNRCVLLWGHMCPIVCLLMLMPHAAFPFLLSPCLQLRGQHVAGRQRQGHAVGAHRLVRTHTPHPPPPPTHAQLTTPFCPLPFSLFSLAPHAYNSLRTATPVEVVPLPRADLEWALAQDARMAQQVAQFVGSASHHDLQAVLAP
jgi:hypothetical protein